MSCCTPSAWGALQPPEGYANRGTVDKVKVDGGEMEVYRVMPADAASCKSDICVYFFYDIGGANQGRTKALCDTFADALCCEVILPDVYLGDATDWKDIDGFLMKYNTQNCDPRYLALIKDEKRKMVFVGTCWGTLPMTSIYAEYPSLPFLCGIQFHPSTRAAGYEGKDEFEMTGKVKAPQMILAAADDVEQYLPGGKTIALLEANAPGSVCHAPFPGTFHGYVPRGDMAVAEMKETVQKSIQMAVDFITKLRA